MKNLIFIALIVCTSLFAQSEYDIVFEKDHSELPFQLNIENSGIYSISSFDILNDTIYFSVFNEKKIYKYHAGNFSTFKNKTNLLDFTAANTPDTDYQNIEESANIKYPNSLAKKYFYNENDIFIDRGGIMTGSNGSTISSIKVDRTTALLKFSVNEFNENIELNFPDNLACVDLIGVDQSGNIFLLAETYLNEKSLLVKREVYTLNSAGEILSILDLPDAKYLYTLKDIQIDKTGNLYHLYSDETGVKIFKWSELTEQYFQKIYYPEKYQIDVHFNRLVPTDEPVTTQTPVQTDLSSVRAEALRIGESYVLHEYRCSSTNLAPTNTTAPDGDIVRTPPWLIVGYNARIPYMWGGFNTLAQFDAELLNGKFAGDINTAGVSSYAVGVDCSGFVSRCWQMSYHASTSMMPNITTQYSSWDDLKPGDAIHKIGHVRLFVEMNPNGSLRIIESTSRGWGVSFWTYSPSDLNAYTPRRYNNMTGNFNEHQPELLSALIQPDGKVKLNWDCDTSSTVGYRVYGSADGSDWNLLLDENSCTITEAEITYNSEVNFYRVSSVANSINETSESYWSNVLGISDINSDFNCLIIDGFERENGSWRGSGNSFIIKYGNALGAKSINFESIKNYTLIDSLTSFSDYDFIFWILGDESSADETFSTYEQSLVKEYLENGGKLFVSGSEIGWDLVNNGSDEDKDFYNNYLKASFVSDNSSANLANGNTNGVLPYVSLKFGQVYDEDYPDVIEPFGGSNTCMIYSTGTVAGVSYEGTFGSSSINSKLIYLGFPPETTANTPQFNYMISLTIDFFNSPVSKVDDLNLEITGFELEQNYPNPFNPATRINYSIPSQSEIKLTIYNSIGEELFEIKKLVDAGYYTEVLDMQGYSSGVYYYNLSIENKSQTRKMILLR